MTFDNVDLWAVKRFAPGDDVSSFECGDDSWHKEVADFLKEDALSQQQMGLSTTTLFYYDSRLVGFTSLLASNLRIEELTTNQAIRELEEVGYKEFPCVLIGQFGVNKECQGRGVGTRMFEWVTAEVHETSIGARFLTLHVARANKPGRAFWEGRTFQAVPKRGNSHAVFMLFDLYRT